MQEATDLIKEAVIPAVKAQKGYQGIYLITDADSGKGLAISVWETEADMQVNPSVFSTKRQSPSSAVFSPDLRLRNAMN